MIPQQTLRLGALSNSKIFLMKVLTSGLNEAAINWRRISARVKEALRSIKFDYNGSDHIKSSSAFSYDTVKTPEKYGGAKVTQTFATG